MKADIGVIGLAVMGENLVMNIEDKDFTVAVYNRTVQKVSDLLLTRAHGKKILGADSIDKFLSLLKLPRRVLFMVKAGEAVDRLIEEILPKLNPGDILIDGGNSHFMDTLRRVAWVEGRGCLYIGCGISGGEEGAFKGPSMMLGGSPEAWPLISELFTKISAKTPDGSPCCGYVGRGGAGHFVKMVHNGIEYGDMQLICEAYHLMRDGLSMSAEEMSEVFDKWNDGPLESYLIEITRDILRRKDEDGAPLIDKILDAAGQKGTGKWTVLSSLDEGTPLTLIAEAVFSRCLSARKGERVRASQILEGPAFQQFTGDREAFIDDLEHALYASKIVSYAQGFALLRDADAHYGWSFRYGDIALLWRGGCIIRSAFLSGIKAAYNKNQGLENLMLDEFFQSALKKAQDGWRNACAEGIRMGIPLPAMTSALSYYDGYRTENLPANLLQAQRDYFGAHTYERADAPRGQVFHTEWM